MQINQTSPIDEIRQALAGAWDITSKNLGNDTWTVVELGFLKIYEANLTSGVHILPFNDLTRTRILEIYDNSGNTKHKILKMKQQDFTIDTNSICRIIFF